MYFLLFNNITRISSNIVKFNRFFFHTFKVIFLVKIEKGNAPDFKYQETIKYVITKCNLLCLLFPLFFFWSSLFLLPYLFIVVSLLLSLICFILVSSQKSSCILDFAFYTNIFEKLFIVLSHKLDLIPYALPFIYKYICTGYVWYIRHPTGYKNTHHSGWSCMFHVHLTWKNPIAQAAAPTWPLSTLPQWRVLQFLLLLPAELPLNYGNLFCPKERSSKTTSNAQFPFHCCYRNTSHSRCPLSTAH